MSDLPGPSFNQPSNAILDYVVDWTGWLFADDSIGSVAWTVGTGLTQPPSPASSFTTTTATIWLSGGAVGSTYEVTCTVTTVAGRVMDQDFTVTIGDV